MNDIILNNAVTVIVSSMHIFRLVYVTLVQFLFKFVVFKEHDKLLYITISFKTLQFIFIFVHVIHGRHKQNFTKYIFGAKC